jgi:hypothetical protein
MPWRKHALEFAEGIRGKDPGAHARGSSIDPIAARGGRAFHRLRRPAHSRYLSSRRNLLRRAKRRFALWNNAEITPPSNSNHFCYGTQQRIRLTLTMLKMGTRDPSASIRAIPEPLSAFSRDQDPFRKFSERGDSDGLFIECPFARSDGLGMNGRHSFKEQSVSI